MTRLVDIMCLKKSLHMGRADLVPRRGGPWGRDWGRALIKLRQSLAEKQRS